MEKTIISMYSYHGNEIFRDIIDHLFYYTKDEKSKWAKVVILVQSIDGIEESEMISCLTIGKGLLWGISMKHDMYGIICKRQALEWLGLTDEDIYDETLQDIQELILEYSAYFKMLMCIYGIRAL